MFKYDRVDNKIILEDREGVSPWVIVIGIQLVGPILFQSWTNYSFYLAALVSGLAVILLISKTKIRTLTIVPEDQAFTVRVHNRFSSEFRVYLFSDLKRPFEVVERAEGFFGLPKPRLEAELNDGTIIRITRPSTANESEYVTLAERLNREIFGRVIPATVKRLYP